MWQPLSRPKGKWIRSSYMPNYVPKLVLVVALSTLIFVAVGISGSDVEL
jgi:hypothetical protein